MRQFYENWSFLEDSNSTVMTDELPHSSSKSSVITNDLSKPQNSVIAITEFKLSGTF